MRLLTKLKQRAKQLQSEAQVLMIAYSDKRTRSSTKVLIGLTVGYLLSPLDLIPDFIPVLGLVDDLIIVPALIALSIKLIPQTVLSDARENLKTNPQRFKRNNWIFAIVIIIVWASVLYLAFMQLKQYF